MNNPALNTVEEEVVGVMAGGGNPTSLPTSRSMIVVEERKKVDLPPTKVSIFPPHYRASLTDS
jgi:hypothetical protein